MLRLVVLTVILAAFWMANSGFLNPLLIIFGVTSVIACMIAAIRMRTADEEGVPLQILAGAVTYLPWLIWEIVKSSWTVTQIILHPKLPISPTMLVVRADQDTPVGQTVYANSITLTPGTITAIADGDQFTVHALQSDGADDLEAGGMNRRVCQFEGSA